MATITFHLTKPNPRNLSSILLKFQFKDQIFLHDIEENVFPYQWDEQNQRLHEDADGATEVNDIIELERSKVLKAARELRLSGKTYTIQDIERRYIGGERQQMDFIPFMEYFIQLKKASRVRKTLKEYKTIVNDLKDYEEYYKEALSFDSINDEFFSKMLDFLVNVRENGVNTVAKKFSTFKTMMNSATRQGYNISTAYHGFKVSKIETSNVYLTREELLLLYHADISNNYRLEKVKDLFCFECFTGLRFSDIDALRSENIVKRKDKKGKEYLVLDFNVFKTHRDLMVPLNKYATELIEKYQHYKKHNYRDYPSGEIGTRIFPRISNQKMNDYLKEMGELVGLNAGFMKTKFIGNQRISKTYRKYKLLTSHAARRTFAILSLEQGMRVEVLQKIMGHSSIRTTMQYVTIMEEVKNDEMRSAWDGFEG